MRYVYFLFYFLLRLVSASNSSKAQLNNLLWSRLMIFIGKAAAVKSKRQEQNRALQIHLIIHFSQLCMSISGAGTTTADLCPGEHQQQHKHYITIKTMHAKV